MPKRLILSLSLAVICSTLFLSGVVTTAAFGADTEEATYEVYALQYCTFKNFPGPLAVYWQRFGEPVDLPFFIWVLKGNNGRNICFDTGFDAATSKLYGITDYESIPEILAKIDLTPKQISDIVISHFHVDHNSNWELFTNAKAWIQRDELVYAAIESQHIPPVAHSYAKKNTLDFINAHYDGRVNLLYGDKEILPGIRMYKCEPGHSYASQFMIANTNYGEVLIAGDEAFLEEHIEKEWPGGMGYSVAGIYRNIIKMKSMVKDPKYILAMHGTEIPNRFQEVAPRVYKIVF